MWKELLRWLAKNPEMIRLFVNLSIEILKDLSEEDLEKLGGLLTEYLDS